MPAATITATSRHRSAAAAPASPAAYWNSRRGWVPAEAGTHGRPIGMRRNGSCLRYLSRCKPHLAQHGAAEQAVGIAQRLRQFEVGVMLADEQLDPLAAVM